MDDKTLPMVNTGKYTHRQHYTVWILRFESKFNINRIRYSGVGSMYSTPSKINSRGMETSDKLPLFVNVPVNHAFIITMGNKERI